MNTYLRLSTLATLLMLMACTRQLPFPEPEAPRLVLGGLFWTDSTWAFSLVQSEPLATDANTLTPVYDAEVEITQADGSVLSLALDPQHSIGYFDPRPGPDSLVLYTLATPLAQPGQAYDLEVRAPGFPSISARDTVPMLPQWLDVGIGTPRQTPDDPTQAFSFSGGFPSEVDLRLRIADAATEDNYYQIFIQRQSFFVSPSTGDTTLFWQEVAYLTDDNSGLRILAGRFSSYVFEDVLFDGQEKEFLLTLKLQIPLAELSGARLRVQLLSLSRSYYQALAGYQLAVYGQSDGALDDVNEFFQEPVPTFTNVEGGYGVFAGASRVVRFLIIP